MGDKERDNSANQDLVETVHRLSQILSNLKSDPKLSPSEEESDLLGLIKDEVSPDIGNDRAQRSLGEVG